MLVMVAEPPARLWLLLLYMCRIGHHLISSLSPFKENLIFVIIRTDRKQMQLSPSLRTCYRTMSTFFPRFRPRATKNSSIRTYKRPTASRKLFRQRENWNRQRETRRTFEWQFMPVFQLVSTRYVTALAYSRCSDY